MVNKRVESEMSVWVFEFNLGRRQKGRQSNRLRGHERNAWGWNEWLEFNYWMAAFNSLPLCHQATASLGLAFSDNPYLTASVPRGV